MSSSVPIIRSERLVDLSASDGQLEFSYNDGPLWDIADLQVWTKLASAAVFTRLSAGFSVGLINDGNDGAVVTFVIAPKLDSSAENITIRLKSARVDERASDVTRAGNIKSSLIERDLDRQATMNQELRRDIDGLESRTVDAETVIAARDTTVAASAVAVDAKTAAEAARDTAEGYKNAAQSAAEASGDILPYDTKADADAALAGLSDGQVIEVFADESLGGLNTRYRVESAAFVHKLFVGPGVLHVPSTTIAAGLGLAVGSPVVVMTPGRPTRRFKLTSGNFTVRVTNDTAEGMIFADGDVPTSVGAWVIDEPEPVQLEWFGVVIEAQTETGADNTAALAAASAALAGFTGTITCSPGYIRTNGPFAIPRHAAMDMPGVVFDAYGSTGTFGDGAVVTKFGAEPVALPDLSADVAKGDTALAFASAHGLQASDTIVLLNPADGSHSDWRTYYKKGGFHKVLSAPTTTTTSLSRPMHYAATSVDFDVYHADDLATGDQRGWMAIAPGIAGANSGVQAFIFDWCEGISFDKITARSEGNKAATRQHCFNCSSRDDDFLQSGTGGGSERYGHSSVNNVSCFWHGKYEGNRHGAAQGGDADFPIHNFDVFHSGEARNHTAGISAADLHGNVQECGNVEMVCYGNGVNSAGEGSINRNITVHCMAGGRAVDGRELVDLNHKIDGIHIESPTSDTTRGMIDFGGASTTAINVSTQRGGTIDIRNVTGNLPNQQRAIIKVINHGYVRTNVGNWDASAGTFPSGAADGEVYKVSVAGTVDSVEFTTNHYLVAVTGSPSTTIYSGNWVRELSDWRLNVQNVDVEMPNGLNIGGLTFVGVNTAVSPADGIGAITHRNVPPRGSKQKKPLHLGDAATAGALVRQDGCGGIDSVETTTGISIASKVMTFPFTFAKAPRVTPDALNANTTGSDRITYYPTNTAATGFIARCTRSDATSNFTGAQTREFSWSAVLEEW